MKALAAMPGDQVATRALPEELDLALRRLATALDRLESAYERQRTHLAEACAVLQDDRSRLAVELDGAIARMQALDLANEEVSRRLNQASAQIRAVLSELAAQGQ